MQRFLGKQLHTARRIWQRLVDEHGTAVAESTVAHGVAKIRSELVSAQADVAVPQTHAPGVEARSTSASSRRQLEALGSVDRLFCAKVSGKNTNDRAQLQQMLIYVRDGDKVRVKSPDRLARSTTDLLALVEQLKAKGVALEFIDNPALNTDTPQGEFMLTVLAAIAQLERKTIRERQAEGIAIARRNGVYDRVLKLSPEQVQLARQRIAQGVPETKVARDIGVSRQTLYAALNGSGKYAEVSS